MVELKMVAIPLIFAGLSTSMKYTTVVSAARIKVAIPLIFAGLSTKNLKEVNMKQTVGRNPAHFRRPFNPISLKTIGGKGITFGLTCNKRLKPLQGIAFEVDKC